MAPIAAAMPGVNRELLVVAIGAGSLIAGHVNDGGFWLVKGYLNTTVPQTLATWTVLETIVAVCGLLGVAGARADDLVKLIAIQRFERFQAFNGSASSGSADREIRRSGHQRDSGSADSDRDSDQGFGSGIGDQG